MFFILLKIKKEGNSPSPKVLFVIIKYIISFFKNKKREENLNVIFPLNHNKFSTEAQGSRGIAPFERKMGFPFMCIYYHIHL